jgi:hypothetical protein
LDNVKIELTYKLLLADDDKEFQAKDFTLHERNGLKKSKKRNPGHEY